MSIYQEYFKLQKELEEKYGKQSVVLMQVGSFYEIYGICLPNNKPPIKIGYTEEISNILSMQIAYKNGRNKPHSETNPQMMGFPDYALGNHLSKLLKAGFTIAVYDQFDGESTKKDRKLVNIYSSSTYIDEEISESNALMVIGIDSYNCPINKKKIEHAKCAIFDLKTGDINLTEIYNTIIDNKKVETELNRLIYTYNPSEIIDCGTIDYDCTTGIENKKIYKIPLKKVYTEVSYQNEMLNKIYKIVSELQKEHTIEHLGLNKHSSLIPYLIHGLQYAYEHDPLIINKVKYPYILDNDNKLILNDDSIYQLNLVEQTNSIMDFGNTKIRSLFGLLNKTRTSMGKRLLKNRLLMPITDIKELERRYSLISKLLTEYNDYDDILRGIADIELKYRKMATKKLQPYDLANLNDTFLSIKNVLKKAKETFEIDENIITEFRRFYRSYIKTFDLEILKESKLGNVKNSYFKSGICPDIDKIQETITSNNELLENLAEELSNTIDEKKNIVIDFNQNDLYYFKTTSIRFGKIPKNFKYTTSDGKTITYNDLKITKLKTSVKITCDYIIEKSKLIVNAQNELSPSINSEYLKLLEKWSDQYGSLLIKISDIISEIDFTMSSAKVAIENKYIKPTITECDRSFINAKDLRHPIIEKIVTKSPYVSNDIQLGLNNHYGTILFALNMAGKSSLLRSVGISVVMAQCGMFVSAKSFEFYPFHNIISKISVSDNFFRGKSLFMVEIDEINNMLRRSNQRTLVLSDELCSSTEFLSGISIVAQTLKHLTEIKTNFIFSSHLHKLQDIPEIRDNIHIKIMHMKVHINNNEIIFDRKLEEGCISDNYGLKISSTLGLPKKFVEEAFNIRNFLSGENNEIISTKQSRYNKNIFMDKCALCGINKSLECHHILFQCNADENNMIKTNDGYIEKNQKFNLVILCKDCHIKIHRKELTIKIEPLKIKLDHN